jgi:predicted glycoside hydrolase/deacetylase ChbG (UPF0249 family)
MRHFTLTADDFGRSPEVNAAVEMWHQAGGLDQASLMVNELHVQEACAVARRNPKLRVGLHLTLCDGLAANGSLLPATPFGAGVSYVSPGRRRWLKQEIKSQFEHFLQLGFAPTYWDGHTHLHLHPVIFAIALPIAFDHGFTAVRLVREPGPPRILPWIFRTLSNRVIPVAQQHGMEFSDAVFGLRHTNRMNEPAFTEAFRLAPEGHSEIYFHPGAEPSLPAARWVSEQRAQATQKGAASKG